MNDTRPAGTPGVLPWRLVFRLIAIGAGLLVPIALFWNPGIVPSGTGLIVGLAGSILGQRPLSVAAGLTLVAATALLLASPTVPWLWAIGTVLVFAAGFETATLGGRAFVLALYGWLSVVLMPSMPPVETALPFLALGLFWGAGWASVLGLNGIAAPPPTKRAFGIGLVLFLLTGLSASTLAAVWQAAPLGYWMVLLFIFRAIAPQGKTVGSAVRYGIGAALGCAVAILVTPLQMPEEITAPLAFGMGVLGLRFLPNPGPWSAAAFTAAILVGTAPGQDTALFRLEAALFVVALTASLAVVMDALWRLVARQWAGSKE